MKYFLLSFVLMMTVSAVTAQSYSNSPYSRFGLGDLQYNSEPVSFAMGGLSVAFSNRFSINPANPASLAKLSNDSLYPMLFNGGFKARWSHQFNNTSNAYPFTASLNSFAIGLRMADHWGMAFGLQPYSTVGYFMQSEQAVDSVYSYTAKYEGSGGLNRFWLGNGITLFNKLNLGFNVSYVFGSLNQTRRIVFDSTSFYHTKTVSSRYIGDLTADAGFQYELMIRRDSSLKARHLRLIIGASAGIPSSLNASESMMAFRYSVISGTEIIIDTTGTTSGIKGSIELPTQWSAGFMFRKDNIWTAGAEFTMQDWSSFSAFGQSDSLERSFAFRAGFSWTPSTESNASYLSRMSYYAGFNHEKTYLSLRGQELTKTGISFGCTFPTNSALSRQQVAVISTGVEIGKMGTTTENLIRENYIRLVLGISFREKWFEKRRYN